MSKKKARRARQQSRGCGLPDARREYLTHLERRGRLQTTPAELRRQAVREPFFLWELGLTRDCYVERVPRYEPGPVIRRS